MQIDSTKGLTTLIKECIAYEGVKGFYKGMAFPIVSISFINAFVFSVNEISKIILNFNGHNPLTEGLITGSIAGFLNSFIIGPIELVKLRLQLQRESKDLAHYKGITDCLNKIYHQKGIKGLFQGNSINILREVPAYAGNK